MATRVTSQDRQIGRCHTAARRWPLMVGNLGWKSLNMLGAPWPMPQLVTLVGLFVVFWQLRPLIAAAVGGIPSLLIVVLVPVVGSLPMRRTRIAGRVPWRWLVGQVALLFAPAKGHPTGRGTRFSRPSRVGGRYWLLPAGSMYPAPAPRVAPVPSVSAVQGSVPTGPSPVATPPRPARPVPASTRPGARPVPPAPPAAIPQSAVAAMKSLLSACPPPIPREVGASVIRGQHEHLIWTDSGYCWAGYRVGPASYANRPLDVQQEMLDARTAAAKTLPPQSLALSLVADIDPADRVAAILGQTDLEEYPDWARIAENTLEFLDATGVQKRTEWLFIPLDSRAGARDLLGSALAMIDRLLGLPARAVDVAEVIAARARAARLIQPVAGTLDLRPADAAEITWVFQHARHRGVTRPPLLADTDTRPEPRPAGPAARRAHLGEATLFDGGAGPEHRRRPPSQRRWLQVTDPDGVSSYQAFLVLSEVPASFAWPGSELFARIDELFDFPVDVATNLATVPANVAKAKVSKKLLELKDQSDQVEEDGGGNEAQQGAIAAARDDLRDYAVELSGSGSGVEVQPAVVLCVWGPDQPTCEKRAEEVRSYFAGEDWLFVRPGGGQDQLYRAMLPDRPAPAVLREYRQYLPARSFAMWMPWTATQVGDPMGGPFAVPLHSGLTDVVLIDPSWGPQADSAGAVGVVGELGSGKSYSGKTLMAYNAARGGLNYAIDRTKSREWVTFARACAGTTQVVDVREDAGVSLDPLRVIPGPVGARLALTFLTQLIALPPMEPEGVAIGDALHAVSHRPDPDLLAVVEELEQRGTGPQGNPDARAAAGKLRMAARNDLGRIVFDRALPVLDLEAADNVVFCTADLALPEVDELANEYRARRIEFGKLFGRAALLLIAALIKERAFTSARVAVIPLDECWWFDLSPEAQLLILELVRDGRKHGVIVWLSSQTASSMPAVAAGLLGTKIVMRTRNRDLARSALEFLGADPDNEHLLRQVMEFSPVTRDPAARLRRAGEGSLPRHPEPDRRGQDPPADAPGTGRRREHHPGLRPGPRRRPERRRPRGRTPGDPARGPAAPDRHSAGRRSIPGSGDHRARPARGGRYGRPGSGNRGPAGRGPPPDHPPPGNPRRRYRRGDPGRPGGAGPGPAGPAVRRNPRRVSGPGTPGPGGDHAAAHWPSHRRRPHPHRADLDRRGPPVNRAAQRWLSVAVTTAAAGLGIGAALAASPTASAAAAPVAAVTRPAAPRPPTPAVRPPEPPTPTPTGAPTGTSTTSATSTAVPESTESAGPPGDPASGDVDGADSQGGLFAPLNAKVHGATLFSYDFMGKDGSTFNVGAKAAYGAGAMAWQINLFQVGFAQWLMNWTLDFKLANSLISPVDKIATTYKTQIIDPIGVKPTFLVIAVAICGIRLFRGRHSNAAAEYLITFLISVLGAGALAAPGATLLGEHGPFALSKEIGSGFAAVALTDTTAAPDLTSPVISVIGDTFVRRPHQLINYNREIPDSDKCAGVYQQIVEKGPWGTDDAPREQMQGCDKAAAEFNGSEKALFQRVLAAGLAALASLLICLLVVVVCGGLLMAQLSMALAGIAGVFVLPLAVLPGIGRALLARWAGTVFASAGAVIGVMTFFGLLLRCIQLVLSPTDGGVGMPLIARFVVIDIVIVAGFFARHKMLTAIRRAAHHLAERAHEMASNLGGNRAGTVPGAQLAHTRDPRVMAARARQGGQAAARATAQLGRGPARLGRTGAAAGAFTGRGVSSRTSRPGAGTGQGSGVGGWSAPRPVSQLGTSIATSRAAAEADGHRNRAAQLAGIAASVGMIAATAGAGTGPAAGRAVAAAARARRVRTVANRVRLAGTAARATTSRPGQPVPARSPATPGTAPGSPVPGTPAQRPGAVAGRPSPPPTRPERLSAPTGQRGVGVDTPAGTAGQGRGVGRRPAPTKVRILTGTAGARVAGPRPAAQRPEPPTTAPTRPRIRRPGPVPAGAGQQTSAPVPHPGVHRTPVRTPPAPTRTARTGQARTAGARAADTAGQVGARAATAAARVRARLRRP